MLCMGYVTEDQVRKVLMKMVGDSQSSLAKAAKVTRSTVSLAVRGAPIRGRLLRYLGFRKAAKQLYERV